VPAFLHRRLLRDLNNSIGWANPTHLHRHSMLGPELQGFEAKPLETTNGFFVARRAPKSAALTRPDPNKNGSRTK
jgi:hypothetical protein